MSSSAKETIKQGFRDLVQGGNSTQYSKDFFDFVKQIGDARTKQDEDRILLNEIRTLKQKMASKELQQKYMKEYLIRMLYIEMLGHDASFGHINAVNMVSSRDLLSKRIGYLAVCLVLHKDHQLMILLVNAFQTDLRSDNFLEVCMALHAVAKLVSVDFIPAVMPHVLALLTHKQAVVRKKAVLCLHRFYQLQPSSIAGLNELILKALCDPDPSVMSSALLVLKEVIPSQLAEYKMIIPSLVTILKQIIEHRLPREYDYHRLPAPWIQMNILHLLSLLCHGDRKSSELVFDLLADVLKRAAISSNIGYSIVYQCIRTITNIYPNTALLKSAAEAVTFFLSSPYNNLKYLGLTSLAAIIKVEPSHAADHQLVVIDCLQSRDETLQHKTLELLYHMTNPTNVIAIVETMVKHLKMTSSTQFRTFLSVKILDLCDLYAPNGAWYVLTVSQLYEIGGDDIPNHKCYSVINFLTSLIEENDEDNVEIRKGLTNEFISKLQAAETSVTEDDSGRSSSGVARIPENLMKTIAWVLGEFAISSGYDGQDVIDLLSTRLIQTYVDSSVRHWILRAIMRVISQLPQTTQLSATTIHIINNAKQSQDVILQQIAEEMASLYQHRAFLQHVLIQPTLSLQVDKGLSFLNPLVERALQSGACGKYIPNYLNNHATNNEKQTQSGLRFEAYAKATPLVRIQPVHQVTNPAATVATAAAAQQQNQNQPQQEGKINVKLGGAKGSWGPKGFNNPNALKPEQVPSPQQPTFGNMTNSDAPLQANHINTHQNQQQSLKSEPANMFGGMIRPKPRPGDIQAQQEQEAKKQQAAKGLFAGLAPAGGAKQTPTQQQQQFSQQEAPKEVKKFAFKTNVSIKKAGQPGAAATSPSAAAATSPSQAFSVFDAPAATPAPKPVVTPKKADAFDLLGGFGVSTPSPAAKQSSGLNLFDFGSKPAAPTPTAASSDGFDLLSSFSAAPTSAPAPAVSTANNNDAFDLFGFGSSTPAAPVQSPLSLDLGSTTVDYLQQQLQKIGAIGKIANVPKTAVVTNNDSAFKITVSNLTNAVVVEIVNNGSTRYDNQTIKVQIQSSIRFDTSLSALVDEKGAKLSPPPQENGNNFVFSTTATSNGVSKLQLILVPRTTATPQPVTFQLAVGTTVVTAQNFPFPFTTLIQPLPIQTKQYADLWKSFGTTGEYRTTITGTTIKTPEEIPPILQSGQIHSVQTIKMETIAAAIVKNTTEMTETGVLLHVKVVGDGSISLHCRSKWSAQAAQQFVESFIPFVQAEEVQQQFEQFKTDALQFWNRAEKLDQKELMTQLKRTAIALGVLGVVGYGVKLVCLPIIQILVA